MNMVNKSAHSLLRWAEKYTKTDMVYLAQGGFWLTFGQAVGSLSAFALSVVFANFVSKETYGIYKYILAIGAVIGSLSLTGLGLSLTHSVARGFDGSLRQAFRENLLWSAGIVVAGFAVSGYYFFKGNAVFGASFMVFTLVTPLINSASLYTSYLNGKKEFKKYSLYWIWGNLAITAATALAAWLIGDVLMLIIAYFISTAIVNVAFYIKVSGRISPVAATEPHTLSYGKYLSLMNITSALAANLDKILVFQFLGPAPLAVYNFAIGLPEQMRGALKSVSRLAFPKFSERAFSEIKGSLTYRMLGFGIAIVIMSIIYIVLAPLIYKFFFPQYTDSILYSQIIALTLFAVIGTIPLTALQAHTRKRELTWYTISINLIQIALTVTLIRWYGLWGAVAATSIHRLLTLIIPSILLARAK